VTLGDSDALALILRRLNPQLRPGRFVFTTVGAVPDDVDCIATVIEDEGVTLVVAQDLADRTGLRYDYVAAMITLRVRSDLASVGLTAAVASTLAAAGISCNVVAGYFHDHLFVPFDRGEEVVELLRAVGEAAK
jgi:hypothetical protein